MSYKSDLIKLPKIGDKIATEIISVYPTMQDLVLAIENNHDLPFSEQVNKALKVYFGKDNTLNVPLINSDEFVTIKCNTELKIRRNSNPYINLDFSKGPQKVKKEIAAYLLSTRSDITL